MFRTRSISTSTASAAGACEVGRVTWHGATQAEGRTLSFFTLKLETPMLLTIPASTSASIS